MQAIQKRNKNTSKCKHVQSLRKANYNQKRELFKEIMAYNLHVKLSLTNLNPGSPIIICHNSAQSLHRGASWYLSLDLTRESD